MHTKSDMCKPELKKTLVLLVTLAMVIASGCSKSATPPGADIAAGVFEQAGFEFLRWEEGLAIMIWHDFLDDSGSFSESQGSASSTGPVYKLEGYAASGDGHRFEWTVHTRDGKTAQFWLDETVYDLSDGALFIVTMQEGKANVTQLDRDLSSVQPDNDSCVAFAKSDPDLARFIGDEPPPTVEPPAPHTNVYHDDEYDLEIRYPADFITTVCPTEAIIADPLLSLRLVGDPYYAGTNLLDACVTVGVDPNVADRSTCLAPKDSHEEYLGQQEINGALFSRISRGGVATGHIYDVTSYRTPHADACYEVTLFLHHSNIGVYTPGTVSEFDKKGIMNRLEQVLYTFKFTDDETASPVGQIFPSSSVTASNGIAHYQAINFNYQNSSPFSIEYPASDWAIVPGDGLGRSDQLQHREIEGCTLWLQVGPIQASQVSTIKFNEYNWKIFYQTQPRSLIYSTLWEDYAFILMLMLPEPAPGEAKSPCQQAAENVLMTFEVLDP